MDKPEFLTESDYKLRPEDQQKSQPVCDQCDHQMTTNESWGLQEYLLGIDGLFHVVKSKNRCTKVLWMLVFVAMFIATVGVININIETWNKSPVVTSVEQININQVLFPAISLCPMDDDK